MRYEVKVTCANKLIANDILCRNTFEFARLKGGYEVFTNAYDNSVCIIFKSESVESEVIEADTYNSKTYKFEVRLNDKTETDGVIIFKARLGIKVDFETTKGGNDMPPKGIREEDLFMLPLKQPVRFDYARLSLPSTWTTPVERRFTIDKVIFNGPATIVYWKDGVKTVVKCMEGDTFSKETGLAMAYMKKLHGNDNTFHKIFKKWC